MKCCRLAVLLIADVVQGDERFHELAEKVAARRRKLEGRVRKGSRSVAKAKDLLALKDKRVGEVLTELEQREVNG